MTPDQLAEIKARLDAATPGPWEEDELGLTGSGPPGPDNVVMWWNVPHGMSDANVALITNAPTDLATLLAYVEQLEGLLRDLCEDGRAAAEAARLRRAAETALAHMENAGLDAYTQDRIAAISSARTALRNAIAPPVKE